MENSSEIKLGNILELFTTGESTKFVNGNEEFKRTLSHLNNRVYQGVHEVITIEGNKINDISIENYEPISINQEWLSKVAAIMYTNGNIEIGKLRFRKTYLGLISCDSNFKPLTTERVIKYVHQLQNIYFSKTGEKLQIL